MYLSYVNKMLALFIMFSECLLTIALKYH